LARLPLDQDSLSQTDLLLEQEESPQALDKGLQEQLVAEMEASVSHPPLPTRGQAQPVVNAQALALNKEALLLARTQMSQPLMLAPSPTTVYLA